MEYETKERKLQDELRTLKEERTKTENKKLRDHTEQIEQLEAKVGVCGDEKGIRKESF